MPLYIKNMVCNRCIMAVKSLLDELEIGYRSVQLGEVDADPVSTDKMAVLSNRLQVLGFELLDDSRTRLIEKIKTLVIGQVEGGLEEQQFNFSTLLSSALHKDYSYLSNLFSEVEGTTIEKWIISLKIEKAKELLVYDELSLGDIADRLGYSSVAHLSAQFKKVTGLTPGYFRKKGGSPRKGLDSL